MRSFRISKNDLSLINAYVYDVHRIAASGLFVPLFA